MTTVTMTRPDAEERPSRLGVVERVTQILDAFSDAPGRLLLEDISRITGLPRSTAFRILGQLVDLHWVEHDAKGYSLGPRMLAMAGHTRDSEDIRAAASVPLNDLHVSTRAVVHLSVLDGGIVHYLDKVGGPASASVPSRVGARILAAETVSGRALLATMEPEKVDLLVRSVRASTDLEALHLQLAEVRRRQGIAVSPAMGRASGISSIGAAVPGPRGAVAAISVAAKGELPVDKLGPLLLAACRRTSRNLFPDFSPAAGATPSRRRLSLT